MRLRYIAAVIVAALLTGCAVVDITKTAKGFYDKTNANDLEILKTRPDRSYDELGTITATGFAPDETAKMHNAIRSKSAALGANAVILTEEGIVPGGWSGRRWAIGVAIRYK